MNKKKRLRNKADKLWFKACMKTHGNKCEVCGKPAKQVHHFFPKSSYSHLRYDINNGIPMCTGCHFTHHTKGDPKIQQAIIEKRGNKWFKKLANKKRQSSYKTIKYYKSTILWLSSKAFLIHLIFYPFK